MPTTEQNITILKHLANDREPGWVAAAVGVTVDHVEQVADEHGWPDHDKVRWAIDELTAGLGRIPTKSGPTGIIHSQRPAAAPTKPAAAPQQQPATPARAGADPIADLLQRAQGSDKARTRNLADKIHGLVADLRARLDDEHAARQAAEKEAREKAARDAEIAKLEQRLAELKGKRPTPGGVHNLGDHPCPEDGCDFVGTSAQSLGGHRRYHHRPEQAGDNLLRPAKTA